MPHTLTIVGVGPGDPGLRSVAAKSALDEASRIVLRTAIHPGVDDLTTDPRTIACDDLYIAAESFDGLYDAIVGRVLDRLGEGDVVYAVPGSPSSGERTVDSLREAVVDTGHTVEVIAGVGGLDIVAAAAGIDLMADSVQIVDATLLADWLDAQPFGGWLLPIVPQRPVIVTQVYSPEMLSTVSAALSALYPDEQPVIVVGWDEKRSRPRRLDATLLSLDEVDVDHLTSVVIPALTDTFAMRSPFTLDQVVAYLRSPDGCPWDREQTNESLLPSIVEEVYEVVDAVHGDDRSALADELGDLLLQPVMQAQIAAELESFDLADVFEAITDKLVRRHPHVFAGELADTPTAVVETWQRVKATERPTAKPSNPYDRLPASMPPSVKIARTVPASGERLSDARAAHLARTVAASLLLLTTGRHDADRLVDAECRILVDRALSATIRKD